jgi:uncharacterized protein YciI
MKRVLRFLLPMVLWFAGSASAASYFLISYKLVPGLTLTSVSPEQVSILRQHGERLKQLQISGVVVTGGRTETPNPIAFAVVAAEDEPAAKAIMEGDPAVKAGILKGVVEPFLFIVPPGH